MGALNLPTAGLVYADAQIAIYTVDMHATYEPVLRSLWQAVRAGSITVVSSELVLMETLVGPLRSGDTLLATDREALWRQANTALFPVTEQVLRQAAMLRASVPSLKTPDAIHAATAMVHGCIQFVTNDIGFRRVPGLPIVILDDVIAVP